MTGPRAVRAAVGEDVDVALTVNGSPVTFAVPARLTLADALRDRLGLTGTHLGCEHGVCGMCTVVVDGAAARSCLLFAAQLDGSEVLTVEGLGRPDDLHPLQEAFGRHHALQCGFCTPGFLMSAYDLLSRRPDVADDELPDELSGVLCRCTGYRNILAAVADVAHRHRDGLPAPKECEPRVLLAVGGTGVPAAVEGSPPKREEPDEVRLPAGEPTFTVAVSRELAAPVEAVWRVVSDVELLAGCLPGTELTERLDEHRARGRARVGVGPIRLSFAGLAQIVEADPDAHTLRAIAEGADVGGARTAADIRLAAEPGGIGGTTTLRADARVHLSGRIAQFGRALAGDVSRRLFEQFCAAVEETARTGRPAPARPPGAVRLLSATVVDRLRALLDRPRALLGRLARLRRPGPRP
jgi:aerobic-type carbon monoxide dehydrogenase small subunit (CoxS/CutS family)/carbon monoxide dehydrogenase subunit G